MKKMKTRIALILPSFAGGGAERVILHLAHALDRDRFDPVLVVLNGEGELASSVPADIPLMNLGTTRLRHALSALTAALRDIRPDAVLSTMGYLNLAILGFVKPRLPGGIRYLVREANMPDATLATFPFGTFGRELGRLAYRLFYRRADWVICNAQSVADKLVPLGVDAARIALVDNPVDVAGLRERVDFGQPRPPGRHFIAVGRMTHQKGFDLLIPWFAKLPEESRLTILGDGPLRGALEALRAEQGMRDRIDMPGFDPSPWHRIAQADAFLMPSRWEGMPNAALESLALGTPVIAARTAGGLPSLSATISKDSLIIADGEQGFVAAMQSIPTRPKRNWERPSALPARFGHAEVIDRYAQLITGQGKP